MARMIILLTPDLQPVPDSIDVEIICDETIVDGTPMHTRHNGQVAVITSKGNEVIDWLRGKTVWVAHNPMVGWSLYSPN